MHFIVYLYDHILAHILDMESLWDFKHFKVWWIEAEKYPTIHLSLQEVSTYQEMETTL